MAFAKLGFSFDIAGLTPLIALVGTGGIFQLVKPRYTGVWLHRFFDTIELIGLTSLFCLLTCFGTYAVAAATTGLADPVLARADAALGFDWPTVYALMSSSAWLTGAAKLAYTMIFTMPIILLAGLGLTGRGQDGRRFALAFGIALAASLGLFALLPAGGPIGQFGVDTRAMPTLTTDEQRHIILALRAGGDRFVDLADLQGLVSFPSVHAASAVLFVWGSRPLKVLFWPMVVTNAAMLLATPIEGNHYLVDVLAGIAIASGSIALSGSLINARWGLPRLAGHAACSPGLSAMRIIATSPTKPVASRYQAGASAFPVTSISQVTTNCDEPPKRVTAKA